jgi:hypothetical protein
MSTKGTPASLKGVKTPADNKSLILAKIPGGAAASSTNIFAWKRSIATEMQREFPSTHQFLRVDPGNDSVEEACRKIGLLHPILPLEDEITPLLSDEEYERVQGVVAKDRARALEVATAAAKAASRVANQDIRIKNLVSTKLLQDAVEADAQRRLDLVKMAATLLGPKCMAPDVRAEVEADAAYDRAPGAHNSCFLIMTIVDKLFGDGTVSFAKRADLELALYACKQKSEFLYEFNSVFSDIWQRCQDQGSLLTEDYVCQLYVRNIAVNVFKELKVHYGGHLSEYPVTLLALMAHVTRWYNNQIAIDPAVKDQLSGVFGADFMAYGVSVLGLDTASAVKEYSECQICGKRYHTAKECWKLTDAKYMAALVAEAAEKIADAKKPH